MPCSYYKLPPEVLRARPILPGTDRRMRAITEDCLCLPLAQKDLAVLHCVLKQP